MRLFERELSKVRPREKGKGRHKPKSWWDGEVKNAIERRQEASREHRHSKQRGEPKAEVDRKWDNFIIYRREASCLISEKMRTRGSQWLSKVHKKDKKQPRNFGNI